MMRVIDDRGNMSDLQRLADGRRGATLIVDVNLTQEPTRVLLLPPDQSPRGWALPRRIDSAAIVSAVLDIVDLHGVDRVVVDRTGLGLAVLQSLQVLCADVDGVEVQSFTFVGRPPS